MREKLKNMMWGERTGEWVPHTYAEQYILCDIAENMPEIPMADPVRFGGLGYGRRNTEVQASLFDAMMAELHGDKARRAEKFRKTHDRCKKSKDDTPAKRKRNKMLRMRKLYGLVFEDGNGWYYEYGSTGFKQTTEPDAEIFRNLKLAEMEKSARADMTEEPEHYVGKTTLSGMIDRVFKRLMEARKPYEDAGHTCYERYYYDCDSGYRHIGYYNGRYYSALDDYENLCRWWNILRDRKMGNGSKYDEDDERYFEYVGKYTFDRLVKQFHPEPHYIDEGWKDWRDYQDELDAQYWKDLAHLDDYVAEERGDYFLTEEEEDYLYE